MRRCAALFTMIILSGCAKRVPETAYDQPESAYDHQKTLAAEADERDQTLHRLRLASMATAHGDRDISDRAYRDAVSRMQDFRADGQFAALVGQESKKEWKGEPYEKLMAFFYLGIQLYQDGQYGNALAMSKSALLADTGTSQERFRSDFIPGWMLQALAYDALGEKTNAERALDQAVDAIYLRHMTEELSTRLVQARVDTRDVSAQNAARVLLLAGLPAGLAAHPRDPEQAIAGALSWSTDMRKVALQGKKADWAGDLQGLKRGDLNKSFDELEPLTRAWQASAAELPEAFMEDLEARAAQLREILDDPGLLLIIERGKGPRKMASGRYGELLQIAPSRHRATAPDIQLDGQQLHARPLDSVTYQATTRGGRAVDGFLKGKAVFKDSSGVLGYSLLVAGDIANSLDDSPAAAILYVAGATVWVAGAVTNPRADTRQWGLLPDELWIVNADPTPGTHTLIIDGRRYTVDIGDRDEPVLELITRLRPYGRDRFGTPCTQCDTPLAIPLETP